MDVELENTIDGRTKSPGISVVLFGLMTTAITLLLIFFLNKTGFQIMGLYILFIVPIGAIGCGVVAGLGYAFGSKFTGAKISGGLLVAVVIIQLVSYFAAQFVEFVEVRGRIANEGTQSLEEFVQKMDLAIAKAPSEQDLGNGASQDQISKEALRALKAEAIEKFESANRIGFWSYFDTVTRSYSDNFPGVAENNDNVDVLGYGVRVLEILGFAFGGLIGPLVLLSSSYCQSCQAYKKTKSVVTLPAGIAPRKVRRKNLEGSEKLQQDTTDAFDSGLGLVEEFTEHVDANNVSAFSSIVNQHKANARAINKLTTRIEMKLEYCPVCHDGTLQYTLVTGHGEDVRSEPLESKEVSSEFVRGILV